jgi:hypothetical protein
MPGEPSFGGGLSPSRGPGGTLQGATRDLSRSSHQGPPRRESGFAGLAVHVHVRATFNKNHSPVPPFAEGPHRIASDGMVSTMWTVQHGQQRTLNPPVRGSSPWQRTLDQGYDWENISDWSLFHVQIGRWCARGALWSRRTFWHRADWPALDGPVFGLRGGRAARLASWVGRKSRRVVCSRRNERRNLGSSPCPCSSIGDSNQRNASLRAGGRATGPAGAR